MDLSGWNDVTNEVQPNDLDPAICLQGKGHISLKNYFPRQTSSEYKQRAKQKGTGEGEVRKEESGRVGPSYICE